jgi:hypothetical protein
MIKFKILSSFNNLCDLLKLIESSICFFVSIKFTFGIKLSLTSNPFNCLSKNSFSKISQVYSSKFVNLISFNVVFTLLI